MRALATSCLAVGLVALFACDGRPAWLGGARPFALFGRDHLRPGISMTKLQRAVRAERRYAFECSPLWGHAQQCVMKVSPGDLRAIVDSGGRVIRLTVVAPDSFFVWETTPTNEPIYRYHANQLTRMWDAIRPHERILDESQQVEYRWTAGQRWRAQMWYSPWARYRTHTALRARPPYDSFVAPPQSAFWETR